MTEETKSVLRIIQGRLEGFAASFSLEDSQRAFLLDTAELLAEMIDKSQPSDNMQELISHVGYDKAQCGYEK